MLERINTSGYESISQPSSDAIDILKRIVATGQQYVVAAEVGVGIGATTIELLRVMGRGELHLFDFSDRVEELASDLREAKVVTEAVLITHGNGRETFNSYAWVVAQLAFERLKNSLDLPMFDFVYLDGAHTFHHDAPACAVLKEMLKPGGYIVFDDMYWTFSKSPTMNPDRKPEIRKDYSDEQLTLPHIERVVRLLMETDSRFEQVYLDQSNKKPCRPVFRRRLI